MYYPKSNIKTVDYSDGSLYKVKSTDKDYVGYYFVGSDDKVFSGKEYSTSSQELIRKTVDNKSPQNYQASIYSNIKKVKSFLVPSSFIPTPTESDYSKGVITRYFIKRKNGKADTIKEVSESDYNLVADNPLYQRITLIWKITGRLKDDFSNPSSPIYGIEDTNGRTVLDKNRDMLGIGLYLNDLKQFAKIIL